MNRRRAVITAMGKYAPEKILTNKDLEKMVDTNDEWIIARTGIKERHIAEADEASSDMAYKAFLDMQKKFDVDPKTKRMFQVNDTIIDKYRQTKRFFAIDH